MRRHHIYVAVIVVIVVLAAFFAGYVAAPKSAMAPTSPVTAERPPVKAATSKSETPVTTVSVRENASTSPSVSIEYPKFPSLQDSWSAAIAEAVDARLTDFRQEVADNSGAREATKTAGGASAPLSTYSFLAKWEKAQVNDKYVSFIIRFDSYVGGANENQDVETFNYDIAAEKIMALSDLFPGTPDYLNKISALARTRLIASLKGQADGDVPIETVNAGTEPLPENFKNFTFTDADVTFYFPKYSVAPGAYGEQKAVIPRSALK
ncbi:MAG: peptidoglycan-N-acetylglucosamine deacetylase [Candidatus Parcubacteria bacterium]|jgi:hypothetical protein|nr:peptidoglycan-N-acetylglucosamine deacetylase [Candidatus Parcubacteria bacterium]